jgi:antitoxin ParD1/3/4
MLSAGKEELMSIDLSSDDRKKLNDLVASGRFDSETDALHAGLEAIHEDPDWQDYARDRIDSGLADLEAGRTRPADEVLAMLRSLNQKKA